MDDLGGLPVNELSESGLWHLNGSEPQAITLAKNYIDQHYRESINLDSLAALVGLTRFSLAKQFRQQVGISPYQYVCRVRIYNAQSLIKQGGRPTEIAGAVGFFDQSHLAKHFKRLCGITPSQYRERFNLAN
ncbi:helix-turn-helix transcriptional regulator [Marinomonas posidonica]|uniref:Transcriptional regulator, AraC family n=1 Tax=Marinomonas posidonica (strain CECT 7376 / NCIMB 14433 / IVIA-Po-181) TaxID=491952 RepID=F6CXX3_MARPP|nr:AraC family transcriptional regulator [Marinomonas posidonica]AEF54535.1 transcriptional regulator, AraC family [Marinomonas posidonica IVIA-Po-181]